MARKKITKKKTAKKKITKKKTARKIARDPRYEKEWIVKSLLAMAETETGIAKINALKELAKMRAEEPPPEAEDISIAFVPIVFSDKEFYAAMKEAKEIN